MHGFKSFAEPAIIEFHEGITCIVGPNGSGKSNISDAIRWVLGEQSPKMLRGGKMEEVIFSGTANRKSRGMAEVTLVIDNTTGILPIDYNEVAITRRMYRSGESEYLINNNQCRLRDIRELIMDTGIGVDGYSIIGQGKIAELVSNKPESRREIFEEAAGVVMYKSKKAESEKKLASATANLERVNDIIAEIEGRIDGLKEDSIKAQEYIQLRDRLKDLEINITLKSIEKFDESNQILQEDIKKLSEDVEKLAEEKKLLDEELVQNRQKNDNLEQLGSDARDKLLGIVEDINRLTNKSQLDAERLNTLDRDFARVTDEITELEEKKARESDNIAGFEEQKKEILAKLDEADKNLQSKIDRYNEVSADYNKLLENIDDSRNRMYNLYNESAAKKSEAKSMESYKESLKERKEQLIEDSKRVDDSKESSMAALLKAEDDKESVDIALKNLQEDMNQKQERAKETADKINKLDKEINHIQIQASQFATRKKTIEEMENNYEGYNGAVRFIMKNNLKGIEGVAADLMEVPRGFEVAIETALGAGLQNVVCQKDQDAKAAVKALKDNKAGRLTFLPMESIKGGSANIPSAVENAQGFKGLGCNLVKYDSKYDGVFKYLLGRVAIVESMQNAIDFSKKTGAGVRFVTLEGEIVNASGAITGGKYKNATANLLERKSEIAKLAEKVTELEAKGQALKEEREETLEESRKIREALQKNQEQEKSLQLEAMNLNVQIKNAKASAKELELNESKFAQQLTNINKDFDSAVEMALKLEKEAEECQLKGEEIKNDISALMEQQESLKGEVEDASGDITAMRIDKNKWDNENESLDKLIARVMQSIKEFDDEIDAKQLKLTEFAKEKDQILFGSDDAEETVNAKTKEKEELEEYIAQVTKEKAEVVEKVEEMSKNQTSVGERLNAYQDQKYQQEIKFAKNETQLDTLKEKLWDEFEVSYLQAIQYKKEDFVMSTAQKESREIKNRMRELGDVNIGSIQEYAQVKERYEFLSEQRADITSAMEQLQAIVDDMERTIKTKFKDNFDKVVVNFEDIFKKLFGGGHAELRLDDEDNPLEAGIEIIAQPPGKKLQNINLMSGGEKTMTAMALMFAVLKTTPTPFCILDEIEAALDDSNVDRFAKYIKSFDDIQFAIITHQKATMEHADVLYGVTMPERGVSKLLSLRLGDNFEL